MEPSEEKYKKGFNHGYLLAQHEPELMKKLIKERNPDSEYFSGLLLGRKEFEREKMLTQIKDQNIKKDKEIERE